MVFIGNQPTAVPLTSSQLTDGIITTAKIADGAVVNVDVNSTAAIAYSKLNLATSIVNGDIANATIALAKLSATGTPSASTFLRGDNSWASAGATAGQVIQVVQASNTTERATNSTSMVDVTGMSVSITPSSASNKVLILVTGNGGVDGNALAYYTILRDSTDLNTSNGSGFAVVRGNSGSVYGGVSMSILDSPNTTSSITYKVRFKSTSGSVNAFFSYEGALNSITALEIKG